MISVNQIKEYQHPRYRHFPLCRLIICSLCVLSMMPVAYATDAPALQEPITLDKTAIQALSTSKQATTLKFMTPDPTQDNQKAGSTQTISTTHNPIVKTQWWNGTPLTVTLPLQQEMRWVFPEPVDIDVTAGHLTTDQLRLINHHGNVYVTAWKSFEATRFYITLKKSGQIILMDVMAQPLNDLEIAQAPSILHIKLAPQLQAHRVNPQDDESNELFSTNTTDHTADTWVAALRFAWQQFYAPAPYRELAQNELFQRHALHTPFWNHALWRSPSIHVHPEASWQYHGWIVTRVQLRNATTQPMPIDLTHDLCGAWQAAMLYPRNQLAPAGSGDHDRTRLFLISHQSFSDVLKECHVDTE